MKTRRKTPEEMVIYYQMCLTQAQAKVAARTQNRPTPRWGVKARAALEKERLIMDATLRRIGVPPSEAAAFLNTYDGLMQYCYARAQLE